MFYRIFSLSTLAVTMFVATHSLAGADTKAVKDITHDGTIVSIADNKLVMTSNSGQQHSTSWLPMPTSPVTARLAKQPT